MKSVEALALQELYYSGETDWDVSNEFIQGIVEISSGWDDYEETYNNKNTYEMQMQKEDEWYLKMLRGEIKRIR